MLREDFNISIFNKYINHKQTESLAQSLTVEGPSVEALRAHAVLSHSAMHQIRTPEYDSRRPRNISESLTAADANSVLNALTAQTAKAVDRDISRSAGQTPTIVHIDAIAVIVDANAKSVVVDALAEGTSNAGKVGIGTVARNALSARKSFVRSAARTM